MANNEDDLPEFSFSTQRKTTEPTVTTAAPKRAEQDTGDFTFSRPRPLEPPGMWEDAIKGGLSGLATGAVGAPGIFGAGRDIADIAFRKLASYPESWITGKPREEIEKDIARGQQQYRQEKTIAGAPEPSNVVERGLQTVRQAIPNAPTPQDIIGAARKAGMPHYDAVTVPGQYAQTAGEFLGGSWLPLGGSLGNRAMGGLGAGLTSETAGQLTKGTEYEPYARFLGSIPGAMIGSGAQSIYAARQPGAVAERSGRIAGDILREAETDPQAVLQRLRQVQADRAANPKYYVEGVEPTTTQMGGASQALEQRILSEARESSSPIVSQIANQQAASREALGAAAAEAPGKIAKEITPVNVSESFGLAGTNPQGQASTTLKGILLSAEEAADNSVKDLWKVPALENAAIYKNKTVQQIFDHIDNMSPSQQALIDPKVIKVLETLADNPNAAIPLSFVQDLRSQVLGSAREAAKSGDRFAAFVHGDIGEKIANIINDPKNIRFGDTTGAARQAWDEARRATGDYYKTFGPSFVKDALSETAAGSAKIAPEALLDKMFSGKNAVQNFKELRGAVGPEAERHAGDWLVGQLTKNGTNVKLTEEQVAKFLADPKIAGLVDEIPGLRARIESIGQRAGESAQEAAQRQLTTMFEQTANGNNPTTLFNFLKNNGEELKSILPQSQHEMVDALQRSADVLRQTQTGGMAGTKTIDRLANNDIFTILYGKAAGAITDNVLFGVAANLISRAMGVSIPGAEIMGMIGGQTNVLQKFANTVRGFANNTIFGATQEQARELLQRAMVDPELRIALMQKPTAANVETLSELLKKGATAAPTYAVEKSIPGAMGYERDQVRAPRATGGKVDGSIAQRLVAAAEKAHKYHQKTTEEILDAPDETVVKALAVAKKNI